MSKMIDEIIAAMTPEQRARHDAVKARGISLGAQMTEVLDQQLDRAKVARDPDLSRWQAEMTLSGRTVKPTTHDHQTPHEIKPPPVIVGPGQTGGRFSTHPAPRPTPKPQVVARTPDQAPRATFSAHPDIKQSAEPRPVYRAVASMTVAEAVQAQMPPDRRAKIEQKHHSADQPSLAQAMKAALTPAGRERFEATQQKLAAGLQARSNKLEDALRQVHAVKRKV